MNDGKVTIFHKDGTVILEPMDREEFDALLSDWREMGDRPLELESDDAYFAFHPSAINSLMWQEAK